VRVICLKWGDKYGKEYVSRLKSMVAQHLPCAHEFVCYTERPVEGVTCEPLPSELPHWWCKVSLFRPGLAVGPNLYLDLDVVIRGDLSGFLRPNDGKVWALDDFSYSLRTPKPHLDAAQKRLLGGIGTCNSSILFWHGDAGRKAWDDFKPEAMDRLHGDQNHLTQTLWPHTLELYPPGLACSYKYHVVRESRQFGSVVVFHGSPKVPDLPPANPLRVLWEAA
jgi:hypothetical protein